MADGEAIALGEGIFNLSSPPKPTRVIQIESTTTPQRKELIQNTSTLPALAGEVAVAQKNQVLRLEKRIEFLEKLQVIGNILQNFLKKPKNTIFFCFFYPYRLNTAKVCRRMFLQPNIERNESNFMKTCFLVLLLRTAAEKHVQAVLRKSNLLQDDIDTCQKNCEGLRRNINTLVCGTEKLKGEISREESDVAKEKWFAFFLTVKYILPKMTILRQSRNKILTSIK